MTTKFFDLGECQISRDLAPCRILLHLIEDFLSSATSAPIYMYNTSVSRRDRTELGWEITKALTIPQVIYNKDDNPGPDWTTS